MKKKTATKKKVVKKRTIRDYQKQVRFLSIENEKLYNENKRLQNENYEYRKINEDLINNIDKTKRVAKDVENSLAFNTGMIEVYERFNGHSKNHKKDLISIDNKNIFGTSGAGMITNC